MTAALALPILVLMFGRAGSGKNFLSKLLIKLLQSWGVTVKYVEFGAFLRLISARTDGIGLEVKRCLDAGILVPDGIVFDIFNQMIAGGEFQVYVVDGFPRRSSQVKILESLKATLLGVLVNRSAQMCRVLVAKRSQEQGRPDDDPTVHEEKLVRWAELEEPAYEELSRNGVSFYRTVPDVENLEGVEHEIVEFHTELRALKPI